MDIWPTLVPTFPSGWYSTMNPWKFGASPSSLFFQDAAEHSPLAVQRNSLKGGIASSYSTNLLHSME